MTLIDDSLLRRFYHRILIYEAKKIGGDEKCIQDEISGSNIERLCALENYSYCLKRDELLNLFKEVFDEHSKNSFNEDSLHKLFNEYFNELLGRGYMINLNYDSNNECFRSIHMDILIRASDVRIGPIFGKMVITTRYAVAIQRISDRADRKYIPRGDGENVEVQVFNLLTKILGNEYTQIFINVFKEYFKLRNSNGFDAYQITALEEALSNWHNNVFVITAPTGTGKTEIFLALMVLQILYNLKNSIIPVIYLIYPRKMLEIDQMERIIILLEILNKELRKKNVKITVYLRDGDTITLEEIYNNGNQEEIPFRGIKCYLNQDDGNLLIERTPIKPKILCKGNRTSQVKEYDFIVPFRNVLDVNYRNINIVVTNLSTLLHRMIDAKENEKDIDVFHVIKTTMMIFDEVHEYDPILLAYISYLIKTIRSIKESIAEGKLKPPSAKDLKITRDFKIVFASATLGNYKDFAKRVSGLNDIVDLSYSRFESRIKDRITGERAIIMSYVLMHPYASWQTYISEFIAFLDYIYYYYKNILNMKKPSSLLPQAIVFINNIRELHRTRSVVENTLSLGSPLDNLCVRRFLNICKDLDPVKNRFILKHYAFNAISELKNKKTLYNELSPLNKIIFSGTPLEEREEIATRLKNKEIACVMATSSLELGVDYPGVTVVINLGFDNISSIIQRIGRGGRDPSTLNTTLGIIIARNNPIDYRNFFNIETTLKIARSHLDPKDIIPIPTQLNTIKYLAALRAALSLQALTKLKSGLAQISVNEFSKSISEIHQILKDYRDIIKSVVGEDYDNISTDLNRIVEIDINALRDLEEFIEESQLIIQGYINVLTSLKRILAGISKDFNEIDQIIDKYLQEAYEIDEELSHLLYVESFEGIEKKKKAIVEKMNKICTYNNKILGEELSKKLLEELLKKPNYSSEMADKIANNSNKLTQLCVKITQYMKM